MEGHHHRHQHLQQQQQQPVNVEADRFPQWSIQETKEFLIIRSELDRSFMETKRNKLLWEVISTKMKEKGYNRSAEQCKCKWKNLVTRYKGCGNMEAEAVRQQFPFHDELQAIFTARMKTILCSESEGGVRSDGVGRKNAASTATDIYSEEEDTEENELDNKHITVIKNKKKKMKTSSTSGNGSNDNNNYNIKEILENFMRQQWQMEMQWKEALEARENERRLKEMEWKQAMEALEKERMMMERIWKEKEEQRRMREEARAEKRDALINALLNKLRREDQL